MITTRLKKLDEILGGGIKNAIITDIFGLNGTGKTQLSLQISLEPLKQNHNVLFIDTTGEFRPERMFEIVRNRDLEDSLLENLKIVRVTNTNEQIKTLEKVNDLEKLSLVIIDNIADLFSFEYSKKEQFMLKYSSFMKYMHKLSTIALEKKIPVIVTNQLLRKDETEYEKLDFVIRNFTHQQIKLEKIKNYYQGEVNHPLIKKQKFSYNFGPTGIIEQSQSI
jgi:DNA repair protein RAD51|tara:strand:- start:1526 stop:2191 length:666 start_codon:yes stop_codon:yes gene_type:complete